MGIMQGRLIRPLGRGIQFFPFEEWEDEFKLAQELEIDEIDFIFDLDKFEKNPLWQEGGPEKIAKAIEEFGIKVRYICADIFMRRPFFRVSEKERQENIDILKRLIGIARSVGAENIEIPLVDNSSLKTDGEKAMLIESIKDCLTEARRHNITISLETDLEPKKLLSLVQEFDDQLLKITYDSGNSSSLGYDSFEEVTTYGNYLSNIHIKDRVLGGTTVPLGEGNADFEKLFSGLREVGYRGSFTLQAARGKEGGESATIASYINFINKYIRTYLHGS